MIWLGRARTLIVFHIRALPPPNIFVKSAFYIEIHSYISTFRRNFLYLQHHLYSRPVHTFISFGRLDASSLTNKLCFQKNLQEESMLDVAVKLPLYWNQMFRSFIRYFKTTSKSGLRKAFGKAPLSVQLQNACSVIVHACDPLWKAPESVCHQGTNQLVQGRLIWDMLRNNLEGYSWFYLENDHTQGILNR